MGPIDYRIQVAQPFESALQGYQVGMGLRQQQEQQDMQEQQKRQAAALQMDLQRASQDPTLIPGLMVRYPQLADKLKLGNDAMTAEQTRGDMQHIGSVASALASDRPDVAAGLLRDRATALRNSGGSPQAIQAAEAMAKWAETDPGSLRTFALAKLSTLPDGDKAVGKILDIFKEKRDASAPPKLETVSEGAKGVYWNGKEWVTAIANPKDDSTPDMKNYREAVKGGFKGTFSEYQTQLRRAGATQVNVPVNTEKSYAGNIAEGLAKADLSALDAARGAPDRVRMSRDIQRILTTERPITGTAAEWRLAVHKALATAGVIDGADVTSTENLASGLASQTLKAISASGLGSGQGFTDNDRKFLERAESGSIDLNSGTLLRLAKLSERAGIAAIDRGNKIARRLRADPKLGSVAEAVSEVEAPSDGRPRMPSASEIEAEKRRRGLK